MNAVRQYALPFRPARRDDICRRRHRGNPESEAANRRVAPHKASLRERVAEAFRKQGLEGYTTAELSATLQLGYTTASARISELKRAGVLVESGKRRETGSGCSAAVVVHVQFREAQ